MAVFALFLAFLGLLGLCIALVALIIRVIFKRGWEKKRIWIISGISLALFVGGMVMGISSVPPTNEVEQQVVKGEHTDVTPIQEQKTIQEQEEKQVQLPEKDEQAASPAEQEQVTQEQETEGNMEVTKEQETEEQANQGQETENDNGDVYIPGLTAADIKLNLEQTWGLQFTGPQMREELAQDNGEVVDSDTGIILMCNIFESSPLHIQWVDFIIDASPVVGLVDVETINSLAEGYFGYCATVPYDGAEPEKAKQWVVDNVSKAIKPGNVLSSQIGPASFEMFGTEYIRTLRIKPVTE